MKQNLKYLPPSPEFWPLDMYDLLSPFYPIRRITIHALTDPLFSFAIICTILVNCYVMIKPDTE